ncbi:MAG TPA: phosphoribosylformylglycinamidine synthase subunit PurL [Dehalococcoidia bacterium]|nr:phosphoribosylformylglycinamidine synthase subunit PurL [Dehalococcoidia bacterium]
MTRGEYEHLSALLGRAPNRLELGIAGALWSEHCSYKTSRALLRDLPTTGPRVLQGPGENAGAVDIGDGLACVFKIESHNHPSAIEPYQGAATGVGGILRDIFTMGARPVALLDSLRFGPYDEPRQRHLFDGVVAGIGGYGNCIGVPTVGGEVAFDECYRDNCIVNAMCVGVVEHAKLTRAAARTGGDAVLLVGADTGRDGIHGASFASVVLDAESESRRPAVQVGNPFLEKCLMEACLELAGDPRIVAMQDLGAAGLCGSASELAHRGGLGIDIDVARVARRERGMTAYEVMLSESQERMLVVVHPGDVNWVQGVFDRWDLHSDIVGSIIDEPVLRVRDGDELVCDMPLDVLVDGAPQRTGPETRREFPAPHARPPTLQPSHGDALLRLLASPDIGSRRPVFRRYDHQVGDGTVVPPGGDAALVRVEGTRRALALSTDGNSRYARADPRRAAEIAVCEAARNVVAVGARPRAITNCLNFANPERGTTYADLGESIAGIAAACRALGVPVVSGNVSLYNEGAQSGIEPTVVVGMVGLLDDVERHCTVAFRAGGDVVALVGPAGASLDGSAYERMAGALPVHAPPLDLDLEVRVQSCISDCIADGLLHSAHDVADGGLAVALAESCIAGGLGARVAFTDARAQADAGRAAAILFGEDQSRFVVSCSPDHWMRVQDRATGHGVPCEALGTVGGERIIVSGGIDIAVSDAMNAYEGALASA